MATRYPAGCFARGMFTADRGPIVKKSAESFENATDSALASRENKSLL